MRKTFEILNLSAMMYDFSPWMRMTLCHDHVIRWAKAKVHVYSDSVLSLGRINHPSEANIKWKEQIRYFQPSHEYAGLLRAGVEYFLRIHID